MPHQPPATARDDLILPHAHDRCRIVGILLRELREKQFPKQAEFAGHITARLQELSPGRESRVLQSNVSRVEGLPEIGMRAVCEGRRLPRQELLRFTITGLGLEAVTASLLLAYSEGRFFKPVTSQEIEAYSGRLPQAGVIPESKRQGRDYVGTHFAVMRLLKEAFGDKFLFNKNIENVTMHHAPEAQDPSTLNRIIFNYERGPGQFMRFTKYPAFTALDEAAASLFIPDAARDDHAKLNDIRGAFARRRRIFHRRMLDFGERNVHSIPALRRYAKRRLGHHLPVAVRRRHLLNLVRLLTSYPNRFGVGLAPGEIETELLINCTRWVLLRATSYHHMLNEDTYHIGPNFVYWSDVHSVMRSQLEFEDCWERLSDRGLTNPDAVTGQIAELLRTACEEEPESGDVEILSALHDPSALRFRLAEEDCAPESFFCEQLRNRPNRRGGRKVKTAKRGRRRGHRS